MKLTDYPIPENNNGFGWHWLPKLADVAPLGPTVGLLRRMKGMGAKWVKLITSPGGDIDWKRGSSRTGACEMTFCAALDEDFGVVVRPLNSWSPPYMTPAMEANLKHLCQLAGTKRFYFEAANEIDAEANRPIDDKLARGIVSGICDFVDKVWEVGQGQIIPVWPSFGYGRSGRRNWFQVAHDLGRGECLDRCGVAVHNYASANRLFEPWDSDYAAGTPLSQEEYDTYPWRYGIGVVGENPRRLIDINAKRKWNAEHTNESEFASGWYTYKWALRDLDGLGHTETPLLLTETGTRVGEMVDWEPRIDPELHRERTLGMIEDIRCQPRIIMSGFWLLVGKTFATTEPGWEDQCCISPTWDRKYNKTMAAGAYAQIKTPGQLPIVDELESRPVAGGKVRSKIGFHIQEYRPDVKAALQAVQPVCVKVMGDALNADTIREIRTIVPGVFIIGRKHRDPSNQRYDDPIGEAWQLTQEIEATGCGRLVDAWESYNEAAISTLSAEQVDKLDQFFAVFHGLVQSQLGVKYTVVINSPCGNLGWPGEVQPTAFKRSLALADTLVSFHGYEWHYAPANDRMAYLFRPFKLMQQVLSKYHSKKFVFTEIGVTRAAVPGSGIDEGWKTTRTGLGGGYNQAEYVQVLQDFETEAQKWEPVIAWNVFQTGAKSDWATFESIEEVKLVKSGTVTPIIPNEPTPEPEEPEEEETVTVVNDATSYGVTVNEPVGMTAGDTYWQAVKIHHLTPLENNGQRNVFVSVLDEQGRRINGALVKGWWGPGMNEMGTVVQDKPPTDIGGCNFVLDSVRKVMSVCVVSPEPIKSQVVAGLHTNHGDEDPEHPTSWGHPGNTTGHHSFLVEFQRATWGGTVEPEPDPNPTPEPTEEWTTVASWTLDDRNYRVQRQTE